MAFYGAPAAQVTTLQSLYHKYAALTICICTKSVEFSRARDYNVL